MGSVFSKFDLLIMPSIWFETFGFVALEAISFGIPVLLSDTCGVKDIIQKITPELIIKMNEDTLYKAILSFLNQPG
jgi:glycosyltransferase involved in cell wall biosynthesis